MCTGVTQDSRGLGVWAPSSNWSSFAYLSQVCSSWEFPCRGRCWGECWKSDPSTQGRGKIPQEHANEQSPLSDTGHSRKRLGGSPGLLAATSSPWGSPGLGGGAPWPQGLSHVSQMPRYSASWGERDWEGGRHRRETGGGDLGGNAYYSRTAWWVGPDVWVGVALGHVLGHRCDIYGGITSVKHSGKFG